MTRALRFFLQFVLLPFLLAPSCRPNRHGGNIQTLVPPSTLTATVITTVRIDLAWASVPLDATGVEIDRNVNGGTFVPLITLPSTQLAFSDTGLTPSTTYGYRIRSVSGSNVGSWTAGVFATTIVVLSVTTTGGPTAPLMNHTAVYDSFHQWMVVFGGLKTASATLTNDLWILDLSVTPPAWSQLAPTGPPSPRARHSAIYDSVHKRMVVYGGENGSPTPVDEVWILDLTTTSPAWSQYTPATPPGFGRMSQTAIYDSAFQRMIVFGGDDGTGPLNDVMQFSLPPTLMDWGAPLPSNPSVSLEFHSSIFDSNLQQMVVFGGNDGGAGGAPDSNLVWVLTLPDPTSATIPVWSQPAPAGPPTAREDHVAAYNPSTQKMAVFGGTDTISANSELWELDLAGTPAWNLISTSFSPPSSGPAARYGASAIFVASGGKMIIFGGGINSTPTFFDVWEVDF